MSAKSKHSTNTQCVVIAAPHSHTTSTELNRLLGHCMSTTKIRRIPLRRGRVPNFRCICIPFKNQSQLLLSVRTATTTPNGEKLQVSFGSLNHLRIANKHRVIADSKETMGAQPCARVFAQSKQVMSVSICLHGS